VSAEPAPPRLVLVDTESGYTEAYAGDGTEVLSLRSQVRDLEQKLHEAEKDLRAKRSKITELQNLKAVERLKADVRPTIERVFDHWRLVTGHDRCTLTADRFDALWAIVKAAGIKGTDDEKLKPLERRMMLAVDGCHFDPWVTRRKNGTRHVHDDLTHIFRSTDAMEEYVRKSPQAAEAERRRRARRRAVSLAWRAGAPDPRGLGTMALTEARMMPLPGAHWQAR
jgi:hypothetical protein